MKYLYIKIKNWFLFDLKLRYKFFLVYFVCTMIPFLLLSIYYCTVTSDRINAHTQENVAALLSQTKDFINYRLESVIDTTNTIYLDAGLYSYLSSVSSSTNYNASLIESKLTTLAGEREIQNVNLYLLDESKIPGNNYRCMPAESAKGAQWYLRLHDEASMSVWLYSSDGHCIYYARKIYSKYDKNKLIGYIVTTINQRVLTDMIDDLCYTNKGIACVVDSDGTLLITRGQAVANLEEGLNTLNGDTAAAMQYIKLGGTPYCVSQTVLSSYSLSSLPQWHIAMLAPYNELFASGKLLVRDMILTALISIVILNMIAAKIIGNITRRMDRLSVNMKQAQPENFAISDVTMGRDEISVLQENFSYMMIRMDQLFYQSNEAKEKMRESELNLLQSQINPHFLYNTLDLINWTARKVGSDEISEITFMLAKFYRLSLRKGVRIVSLADELCQVRQYVGLQNKRFEDAISLCVDVPEEHAACASLKMMLQPIVENAVLHGILEKDVPSGNIRVYTERRNGVIDILIEDDGVGIPSDTLEALNHSTAGDANSGIGVANTVNRIRNCFGNDYGIFFTCVPGSCTRVRITIPFVLFREDMSGLFQIKTS